MKEKIAKTNVARLLDKAKIAYELIPYEVDENDLSAEVILVYFVWNKLVCYLGLIKQTGYVGFSYFLFHCWYAG